MTDHSAPLDEPTLLTQPDPWHNPPTIGLWGPPGTEPGTRRPRGPRARKPYGLGDIGWLLLAYLGLQILTGIAFFLWAAIDLARHPGTVDPAAVQAQFNKIGQSGPAQVVGLIGEWLVVVGVPWLISRRKGLRSLAKDYGLRFQRRDPLIGLGLAVGAEVLFGLLNGVVLPALHVDQTGADNVTMVTGQAGIWVAVLAVAAALGAPVAEEILFRGFLLRAFMRRLGGWDDYDPADGIPRRTRWVGAVSSAVITSVIFGALHMLEGVDATGHVHVTAMFLLLGQTGFLGLVFALVAIKTRRLGPTICAHICFNGLSLILALVFGG